MQKCDHESDVLGVCCPTNATDVAHAPCCAVSTVPFREIRQFTLAPGHEQLFTSEVRVQLLQPQETHGHTAYPLRWVRLATVRQEPYGWGSTCVGEKTSDSHLPGADVQPDLSSDHWARPARSRVSATCTERRIDPWPWVVKVRYCVWLFPYLRKDNTTLHGIALQILMGISGAFHQIWP